MLRVAIVHDWLELYAGSERVLKHLLRLYPQADVYSLVDFLTEADRAQIGLKSTRTTFIQRFPGARKHFRAYLPLFPLAVEQLDISSYDLVISSSHSVAKGVICGPDQTHVSYCHSPMRYVWDLQHQYLREHGMTAGMKSWVARASLHYLRMWDVRTANGVDAYAANSLYVAERIRRIYGRDATVVYPPVDVDSFRVRSDKEDFYVTVSRLVPYKHIGVIVDAFSQIPDKRLVVIGDGPQLKAIEKRAAPNIEMLGHQPHDVVQDHVARAKAFIFAAEEDFGIAPVEAQAAGTPVIAYGRGGVTESVIARKTGLFFGEQTPASIRGAIAAFESGRYTFDATEIRANAERFSPEVFARGMQDLVERTITGTRTRRGPATLL